MSVTAQNSFARQYSAEVKHEYQIRGSKLRDHVRRQNEVQGATTTFQRIGKGTPSTKARNGQVTPMNVTHTPVDCTLADYYAGDWVDMLDLDKMKHDERRVIVQSGAAALGRKTDELIITGLTGHGGSPIAAGGTGMTLAKVLSAMKALGDKDVFEEGKMTAIVPWDEWTDLLAIEQFANADYVGDKPVVKGTEARTWLGTLWMPHSGLEPLVSGGIAKSFWFHMDAVGQAVGRDIETDVTWHGDRAAWFVNAMMSQGACLIDGDGVAEIQTQR